MKSLVIDCGATKADWYVSGGRSLRTRGFNLAHTPADTLQEILDGAAKELGSGIDSVHFYAAGLVGESPVDLGRWFPGAAIEYASDMLGAARAVCGHEAGIAVILGTGANTCLYGGKDISWKVNCGGFILGDEGSASVLGRLFVTDFIKGCMPAPVKNAFAREYQADYPTLVHHVYGAEAPARYLGSFAPFILQRYEQEEYVKNLVDNNFRGLFERTIVQYPALPVGVVGGFGFACQDILRRIGAEYGVSFSRFLSSPIEGLIQYHAL